MKRRRPRPTSILLDPLEPRLCFGAQPIPTNINISRARDNHAEGAIAIDPTNPNHMFAASNLEFDDGLFTAVSNDGGATWSTKIIADGSDGLARACCDPSAAFDEFGNLYVGYMNTTTTVAHLVLSTDGGSSFRQFVKYKGDVDQPTVTTGHGMVWMTFSDADFVSAAGGRVFGLNSFEKFSKQRIPSSAGGNFGDLVIGPDGQVMVTFQKPVNNAGPSDIFVSVDPDGRGPEGFKSAVKATSTKIGGFFTIPAQPNGEIDAEADLAYDTSSGPFSGRVYLAYTGRGKAKFDTNIQLRFSDDDGAHWSAPIRVNDDQTQNSQILPRVQVDPDTGNVALVWHDARNDDGHSRPGTLNSKANDDTQFWGTYGTPTANGVLFVPNFQISAGTSSASRAGNQIDYGDYTGLAFEDGHLRPVWADNSNSTKDNPQTSPRTFDLYTALIEVI